MQREKEPYIPKYKKRTKVQVFLRNMPKVTELFSGAGVGVMFMSRGGVGKEGNDL